MLVVVPAHEVSAPVDIGGTRILFRSPNGYYTQKLIQVLPRLEVPLRKLISAREKIRLFIDSSLTEDEKEAAANAARTLWGLQG